MHYIQSDEIGRVPVTVTRLSFYLMLRMKFTSFKLLSDVLRYVLELFSALYMPGFPID